MVHTEVASINFLKWDPLYENEKPFQVFLENDLSDNGVRNTNLTWEEKDVQVEDFRDNKDCFDIDNHGFTSRKLTGFEHLETKETIDKLYIPAIGQLLKEEIEDVETVFIYDWRIRDTRSFYPDGRINFGDQSKSLLPSNFAHVDMAPISIVNRIQNNFPNDAEEIFAQRVRAINVWKPLDHPVDQWALAVCDGNTIPPATLMETDSVRRENITTLYYALHAPGQKWHFLHRQRPDEALIFKHFDSKPDVQSSLVMHSSIRHHNVAPDARPRRSIEVRALVFSKHFEPSHDNDSGPAVEH